MRTLVIACCCLVAGSAVAGPSADAAAVVAQLDRIAERPLWPGFDLRAVPLAIFDGTRTFLFRHPSPPPEFVADPATPSVRVFEGRHPAVRASTVETIGGVLTATLILADARGQEGPVMAHEAFHAWQRTRHPGWITHEMELLTYPVADGDALGASRLETEAWRRALAAPDAEGAACWAARALAVRRERFTRMSPGSAAYERGIELVEGTASLVQWRAGDTTQPEIPAAGFPATAVRYRGYAVGRTLGRLLDRFVAGWEERLETTTAQPVLDAILDQALAGRTPCDVPAAEAAALRERARLDAAVVAEKRTARRRDFLGAAGHRVVLRVATGTFELQGFDPMNVHPLRPGEVLHARMLKLGRGTSVVEVFDRPSLASGDPAVHPLLGMREIVLTGLPAAPTITTEGTTTSVTAPGLTATLERATVEKGGLETVIVISG